MLLLRSWFTTGRAHYGQLNKPSNIPISTVVKHVVFLENITVMDPAPTLENNKATQPAFGARPSFKTPLTKLSGFRHFDQWDNNSHVSKVDIISIHNFIYRLEE